MDTTKSEVYLTMKKETLVKIIDNKRDCIKMLKQRIDKAIEYIDKLIPSKDINYPLDYYLEIEIVELFELLDILKGSDKE